ncbi:hypothetical protein CAAN1_05S04236 [[Candida] anglica]|uniref:Uncharacterized protein n=1 Tax=[Candida] anglica TaxID=148631 RepID=A0ABP0ED07_9ASCO
MSSNMPGYFPSDRSTTPIAGASSGPEMVELMNTERFMVKNKCMQKNRNQRNLILQLDMVVYILVAYQLIRHCYSAAMIPVILHIGTQKFLSVETIVEANHGSRQGSSSAGTVGMIPVINDMIERSSVPEETSTVLAKEIRSQRMLTTVTRICVWIYWKTIIVSIYHIVFVQYWLMPFAMRDELALLQYGTWWFISFVGETPPTGINKLESNWERLSALGLPGLILTNLLILFVQLVIFQSTYIQSTVSPLGRRLHEKEIEILRVVGDSSGGRGREESADIELEVPTVLSVRLYEVFRWDVITSI